MSHTRAIAITAVLAIGGLACSGFGRIPITQTATTVIPAATLIETVLQDVPFGGFADMDLTANQELQNQGVSRNQITDVHITSLSLAIQSPSGGDFSFLTSVAFFVEAEGEERRRVAHGGPFPEGEDTVELELDDVDLAPYAAADSMSITTEAEGSRPQEETTVEATLELDVGINVGGVITGG